MSYERRTSLPSAQTFVRSSPGQDSAIDASGFGGGNVGAPVPNGLALDVAVVIADVLATIGHAAKVQSGPVRPT